MSRVIAFDLETPYSKDFSVVDLGYWKYARDPRCVPYLVSVYDGAEAWAGSPADFNFDSLKGATLLSHNAAFDEEISLAAAERGLWSIPDLKPFGNTDWHCTLNMSAFLWNVRSLKDAAKYGLGIEVSKDVRDRAKNKTVEDMKREGWWDEMLQYGRDDAVRCWMLWHKHSHRWPEIERRLSRLTIDQGRYGVRIDVPALEQGIDLLEQVIFTAQQNLPWVARGKKPASPIGIAEECRNVGIPQPPVKAHDPEAAQEWENTYAPKHKFVLALRNIRKAKKSLATLETIKLRLRPDDTVPFSLKYAGAHTLRWSGDSGWNLQNQSKEPLFIDPETSFVFDKKSARKLCDEFDGLKGASASGVLSGGIRYFDMRGLIIPREGMKLASVDLSQIEPRVLNHLAGNQSLLEKVKQGLAIYEAHARETMGWTGGDLKTQDKKLYALAKARTLGLGYGCAWEKFILVAQIMAGIDITEGDEEFAKAIAVDGQIYTRWKVGLDNEPWQYDLEVPEHFKVPYLSGVPAQNSEQRFVFAKVQRRRKGETVDVVTPMPVYGMRSRVTVEEFRRSNPLIVELWRKLDDGLRESVGSDFVVTGPHGGQLVYKNVRCERREAENKDTGEKYEKTVYTAEIGGHRCIVYGALIAENVVQWVSRMAFAERMLDMHDQLQAQDPRQWVLFSVHDEGVPEVLGHVSAKWLEQVMSVTPDWLEGCPLAAEAKILDRYAK